MRRDIDARLLALGSSQYGWVSTSQARRAGADKTMVARRVRAGAWVSRYDCVYRPAGYPDSFVGDLWAAHLAAGPQSFVGFESAGCVQRMAGFKRPQLVLVVLHPSHLRLDGVTIHQLTDVAQHELTMFEGLPITMPQWTLVDLSATASRARLRTALDDAFASRLTTPEAVGQALLAVTRRGKPGVLMLAELLDRHRKGPVPPRSILERALFAGLAAAGEPLPISQWAHPGRHPVEGCVDGGYPAAKLIVEADGRRWHDRIADAKRDRDRDNEAARAGIQTLRFLYEHIVGDIDDVVATIREVRLQRLELLAGGVLEAEGRAKRAPQPRERRPPRTRGSGARKARPSASRMSAAAGVPDAQSP